MDQAMRGIITTMLVVLLPGCGWYLDSFKGRPGVDHTLAAPPKSEPMMDGTVLTVVVHNNNWRGWCTHDAAGIGCTFGYDWIVEQARFTGGYEFLSTSDAESLCSTAAWSLGGTFTDQSEVVRVCGSLLMQLRMRELAPPKNPEYQ